MSFLNLSDVSVSDGGGSDAIPAGKYLIKCLKAEVSQNKKGNGRYIKAEFRVEEGDYQGRKMWHYFNIEHTNDKVQRIGLQQVKSFLTHANYTTPDELKGADDMVGLKSMANVKVEKSEEYGDSNRITSFAKKDSGDDQVPF
jgi:hypothetical protein